MFDNPKTKNPISPIVCSNWFIKADQGNKLLQKVQNFIWNYYKRFDGPIHYFIYHLMLSALVDVDVDCKRIWNDKIYVPNTNAHVLQRLMQKKEPHNSLNYEWALENSFVNKLSRDEIMSLFE